MKLIQSRNVLLATTVLSMGMAIATPAFAQSAAPAAADEAQGGIADIVSRRAKRAKICNPSRLP
jgi:hypothetical protein